MYCVSAFLYSDIKTPAEGSVSGQVMSERPKKRRVLSEGDKDSLDAGDAQTLSIATMSDPSIHFDFHIYGDETQIVIDADDEPKEKTN